MTPRTIRLLVVAALLTSASAADNPAPRTILFLGDSLTAGFGLESAQAFPAHIQQKIEARGWPFVIVNAGLSGDTSASGLRRIDWLLRRRIDVLVLALGANDALRGVPLEITRRNLQHILDKVQETYPEIECIIAGMEAPPNLGAEYTGEFRTLFKELAEVNELALIPFLLEGVAGHPEFNLPDRIHPNPEGHKMVAGNVWAVLQPLLTAQLETPQP